MTKSEREQYYEAVIAVVRADLAHANDDFVSPPELVQAAAEHVADPPLPDVAGSVGEAPPLSREPGWHAYAPRGGPLPPPHAPPWKGIELVDVVRLGDFALIAFHWRETGDELFVKVANLREHFERGEPVNWAPAIISMNLLENIGTEWHLHHPLTRFHGFTLVGEEPPRARA